MAKYFMAADILLPHNCDMNKWAVIACDQYTSDKAYWNRVRTNAQGVPSTLHMIIPEAELGTTGLQQIEEINQNMQNYLDDGVFCEYKNAYIYVERTMKNGTIRQGIVGCVDLEAYEYDPALHPMISATESTVLERIPPRVAVRENAPVELPHVLLLCDDVSKTIIESVAKQKDQLKKLYDFDLMENGGHIAGWLLSDAVAKTFDNMLHTYEKDNVYLVGDGNHSLVTAKTCYEKLKRETAIAADHPARYALVELENIHSPAMAFEPIHRIITNVDTQKLLSDMQSVCSENGAVVRWICGDQEGLLHLAVPDGELTVGVLQDYLDRWLQDNPGTIDYIHDEDAVISFAREPETVGFLLHGMGKNELFPFVQTGRTLPRKTFSMGHGSEKRYYLEGRKIK